MIPHKAAPMHWRYFLAMEGDIMRCSNFLEIATSNFSSYSIELGRILFAAASETEIVMHKHCQLLEHTHITENIGKYRSIILDKNPELITTKIHLPKFGITLSPWNKWRNEAYPTWWRAYHKLKYERQEHFAEASMKNALNAVAALYALLLFYCRNEAEAGELSTHPHIFLADEPFTHEVPIQKREDTRILQMHPEKIKIKEGQ